MFKLDLKSILIGTSAFAASALLLSGCMGGSTAKSGSATVGAPSTIGAYAIKNKTAIDGGVTYVKENGQDTAYAYNQQSTKGVSFGRTATPNEIKATKRLMPLIRQIRLPANGPFYRQCFHSRTEQGAWGLTL